MITRLTPRAWPSQTRGIGRLPILIIVMMRWRSHPRRQAATVETGEVGGPKSAGLQASQMSTAEILQMICGVPHHRDHAWFFLGLVNIMRGSGFSLANQLTTTS